MKERIRLLATPAGLLLQSVVFAVLGILFFTSPAFVIAFLFHILIAAALVSAVLSIGSYAFSRHSRMRRSWPPEGTRERRENARPL